MEMTRGMASPSAWGQAMTSTVAVRTKASSGSPRAIHTTKVSSTSPDGDVEERRGSPVGEGLGP